MIAFGIDIDRTSLTIAPCRQADAGSSTGAIPCLAAVGPDGATLFGQDAQAAPRDDGWTLRSPLAHILGPDEDRSIAGSDDLASAFLAHAKATAEARSGHAMGAAAFSVPAPLDGTRRDALAAAAERAGIHPVAIIARPDALWRACSDAHDDDGALAVLSWDGASLDLCLSSGPGTSRAIANFDLPDLDGALARDLFARLYPHAAPFDDRPPGWRDAFIARAREVRERLSVDGASPVSMVRRDVDPPVRAQVSRFDISMLLAPVFADMSTALRRALEGDRLRAIVSIGRRPAFASDRIRALAEALGAPLLVAEDAQLSPADGAALICADILSCGPAPDAPTHDATRGDTTPRAGWADPFIPDHPALPFDGPAPKTPDATTTDEPIDAPETPDDRAGWIRFDMTNAVRFKHTRPAPCRIGGHEIVAPDWERVFVAVAELFVAARGPRLELLSHRGLFSNEREPFLLSKAAWPMRGDECCSQLSDGHWIVVRSSIPWLMRHIGALCRHCGLKDEDIELWGVPQEEEPSSLHSDDPAPTSPALSSAPVGDAWRVEDAIRAEGPMGIPVGGLARSLAMRPSRMRRILAACPEVIDMPGGCLVHASCLAGLEEARDEIGKILARHFRENDGYSNARILFDAARASGQLSRFLNDNALDDERALFAVTRWLLARKGGDGGPVFEHPHIFRSPSDRPKAYPATIGSLMIARARRADGVLDVEEAKAWLESVGFKSNTLGWQLKIGASDSAFLMRESGQWILREALELDGRRLARLRDLLDGLFSDGTAWAALRGLKHAFYRELPSLPAHLEWTPLLLQEAIRKTGASAGHRVLFREMGRRPYGALAAAIVPERSPLRTFADLVHALVAERRGLPATMITEDLRYDMVQEKLIGDDELRRDLHRALADRRFKWTDLNGIVCVREG